MFVFVSALVFLFVSALQRCNHSVQGCGEVDYGLCVIQMSNLSMFVFVFVLEFLVVVVFVLVFVFVFALQRCNPRVRGCGEVDYGLLTSSSGVEV